MVASEKKRENNEVTAWSDKGEYKMCDNKKSDELLEKSINFFRSDHKIKKRNKEQAMIGLNVVKKKERSAAGAQPKLSESQKDTAKMIPSLDSKQKISGEECVEARDPVEVIGKEFVCLEENFENTETVLSFAMSSDQSSMAYDPKKDKIELQINKMKKEMDAAKIKSSHTCSQVKNLQGKIVELGKVVEESSVASKGDVKAADLKSTQELKTSRYECSKLKNSIKVLKKDVVNLEEKLGNAISSKREQNRLNEKSIATIIEEKGKVVGRMELTLAGLKKELDASKKDSLQAGSRVKDLTEKIAQLENAAAKKTAALNMHLKSKQELERFLKNVLQQDKGQFDEESISALTASFATENLEESLITNQYISSIIKEREDTEATMELQISETKKELDTSKQGYSLTINHMNTLEQKIIQLEKTVIDITAASGRHVKAKQELSRCLDKEKLIFEIELKKAQMTVVASTAKVEKIELMNKSLSSALKEKDNAVAQMERKIAERENEGAAVKMELQQAGSHVKNLTGKIADLEHVVTETTASATLHAHSKKELDLVLQEKLTLEEQLKRARATVLISGTKLERSLLSNTSMTSAIKEKESALAVMESKISGMKVEFDASQKELCQSGSELKILQEKIRNSEDEVTELKTTSSMHLKSVQDLKRVQKEENLRYVGEQEQAQAAVVASNAKLEKSVLTNKSISLAMKEKDSAVAEMELKICDMKKKVESSQKELFETVCEVKTQYDKIAELEKAVIEKTVASKYLSSNKELESLLRSEKLKFKEELKRAQLSVISSTAKLEKSLLTNKSASSVLQEKDGAAASMERMISDMEKELEAAEKELSWMGSIVKNQERTIVEAEASVSNHAAASAASLKSKQEMEAVLKKKIARLEKEVKKAQEAATSSEGRLKQQIPTYQTVSSSLKEREKEFVHMQLKIRTLEDKLGASEEDCYRSVDQARNLHRKVTELEKAAEDRSLPTVASFSTDSPTRPDPETALRHRTAELERELDATRQAH
eukprot:CAMPEP_0194277836 /NCGR_PEP_ID=MMETSP0169-20130528/10046_1 /TAXON_ID=218684 /ORGANISM="Corethron pennatum, Strain L29A3" /LENGTH=1007 /DNA_ID=CAMNT_0039021891 /DNA_START=15 /DNA_END=3035 /DNA_ORIENTATION=+